MTQKFVSITAMAAVTLLAGCGQTYRPVVTSINPVGPAGQPLKYAVAVSNTGSGAGLLNFVDFSGDSIVGTQPILNNPSTSAPLLYTQDEGGANAFIANAAGTLQIIGLNSPSTLKPSDFTTTTLPMGGNPAALNVIDTPYAGGGQLFLPEPGRSAVAILSTAGVISQELAVTANPVWVAGNLQGAVQSNVSAGPRVFVLSQGTGTGNGVATAVEVTTNIASISNVLPVGVQPVYGVITADNSRAFIVNKGSGNVTVINAQQNQLDQTTPVIPATGTLGVNPVWAVLVPTLNELLVLNQGNGTTAGTLSIISIPSCNAVSQPTNPLCTSGNIQDGVGFGTVVATVTVGVNPTMVAVLSDGSEAYVVNSGNSASGINGSVSSVNLSSNIVTATIPASPSPTASQIAGHPNTIAVSYSEPTSKVYVTAPDSQSLTVIRTDTDTVDTKIPLQGNGVRVLLTRP